MTSHITAKNSKVNFYYLLALCLPVTIACIDVMAVSIAVAPIMNSFSCSLETAQWLLSGYTIGTAAFLITIGRLADRYGRKKILMIGVWIFALSSLFASVSPEIHCLILSRFFQGTASAIMMTTVMSIITHEFAPQDRGGIISTYGFSLGLGLASGPAIGGVLITYLNWQAIFLINLPICFIAGYLVLKYLPESKNENKQSSINWLETIVLSLLLLMLVTIISQGALLSWFSLPMIICYSILVIMLVTFVYIEYSNPVPIIDFSLLIRPNFFGAMTCGFISYFCMYAWLCVIGIYLQNINGLTVLEAGLLCTPFSLAFAFSSRALAQIFKRYTNKSIMQVGFLLTIAAFIWMAFITPLTDLIMMLMMFFLLGVGITVINAPSMVAATEHVPLEKAGLASGLIFTIRWLGGSVGIIIVTSIYHAFSESLVYSCSAMAFAAFLGLLLTFTLKSQRASNA